MRVVVGNQDSITLVLLLISFLWGLSGWEENSLESPPRYVDLLLLLNAWLADKNNGVFWLAKADVGDCVPRRTLMCFSSLPGRSPVITLISAESNSKMFFLRCGREFHAVALCSHSYIFRVIWSILMKISSARRSNGLQRHGQGNFPF